MGADVFGSVYADQYDVLYRDKDYEAECTLLEDVFRRYGEGEVHAVLDLGCGTGNHAIPLARRGYAVTGVDRSAAMLAQAKRKAEADARPMRGGAPAFAQGDVRTVDLRQRFDAVLMMFAVLGYQTSNDDVLAALRTARRHVQPGGLFVCDVWYGPAVLGVGPTDRAKVIDVAGGQVIRVASGRLDERHHVCTVRYRLWRIDGAGPVRHSEEAHTMRYFFPMELEAFLAQTGFRLCGLHPFGRLDAEIDSGSWNALVCARAAPPS